MMYDVGVQCEVMVHDRGLYSVVTYMTEGVYCVMK